MAVLESMRNWMKRVMPFVLYCYYRWLKSSDERRYEEKQRQRDIEWESGREEREKWEAEEKELARLRYEEEVIAARQREYEERLENATRWMSPEKPVIPPKRRVRLKKTEPDKKLSPQQKKAILEYRHPAPDEFREQD